MKILTFLIFLSSLVSLYSQEVNIKIDKYNYQFEEIIEITYELDIQIDSIQLPDLENFKFIYGPFQSTSSSYKNGKFNASSIIKIILRPVNSGELSILSPIFYYKGKKIKAKPVIVNIAPTNLSEEEIAEIQYKEFIDEWAKPKGTSRIVIHKNKGYIEIYNGKDWEFQRRLTKEEIEELERIF